MTGSTTLSRRHIHTGRVIDIGTEEVRLENGVVTTLDVIKHPGASLVVPLHDDGSMSMIQQHRHCAQRKLWEFPAGTRGTGESHERCAVRELEEEAGLVADSMVRMGSIFTAPGFTDEEIVLFVATGLRETKQNLDDDEVIVAVQRFSLEDLEAMLARGELQDAKSLSALSHVRRYHKQMHPSG
jgi:ADP-ribose pyrophosphatase